MTAKEKSELARLQRKWAMRSATAKEVRRCMELETKARQQ